MVRLSRAIIARTLHRIDLHWTTDDVFGALTARTDVTNNSTLGGEVPKFEIKVLGRIDVVTDGQPLRLPAQEAKALAILVAARRPVSRQTLIASIWGTDDGAEHDRLSPIISRLRDRLSPGGLTIPLARESREYELTAPDRERLTGMVDAYRFERSVRAGRDLLAGGQVAEAVAGLRTAAADWQGTPFTPPGEPWDVPGVCAGYRRRLDGLRADLVRQVAQTALLQGRYEIADFLTDTPVAAGHRDGDPLWLLRFLVTLRDDGVASAEAAIETRRARTRYDDILDRAYDLTRLQAQGVEVHGRTPVSVGDRDRASPEHLVGRADELTALTDLVHDVTQGRPALLRMYGVAGVGKTRLLGELERLLPPDRPVLVVVTCADLDDLQPWRVLTRVLWTRILRDLSTGSGNLTSAERAALADFISATPSTPAPPGHERAPEHLLALLCALLRQAAQRGLVVAFDNADLLSPRATEVLRAVRHGLGAAAVGFVLAGRPTEAEPAEAAEPDRAERSVLWLPALGASGVQEWLADVWGREPSGPESAEALRLTGGLPVRLCEVRQGAGELAVRPGPLLGRPDRTPLPWLAAAAVGCVGLEIDAELVTRMLDLPADEADRQLRAAIATRAVDGPDGGLRFRYDLWREEVLAQLQDHPALLRRLHRRAAELLSEQFHHDPWPDPALPVRIARHTYAAGTASGLSGAWLAGAYLDAARAEQRGFAADAAVTWAGRGLRQPAPTEVRFGLLLTLGDAHNDGGGMAEAGRQYRAAYDVAAGLPRLQATAAIQLARQWSDPGQVDQRLLRLLTEALDRLAADPHPDADALRLRLSAHVAHKSSMAVSPDSSVSGTPTLNGPELALRTLAELTESHPPVVACEVLTECRWGRYDFDPPARSLELARRLHDTAIHAESGHFLGEALVALAVDLLRLGEIRRATAVVARHRGRVEQHPHPLGRWLQNVLETLLDLWMGQFDRAEERIQGESREMVRQLRTSFAVPADTLQQTWDGQHFWLLRERGRMGELFGSDVAQRVERHGYFPIWRAGLILAAAETDRFRPAMDGLTAMVTGPDGLAALPPHGYAVPTLALLAEASATLHQARVDGGLLPLIVARLRELLAPHSDELALAGWPTVLIGPVARVNGLLALAAGEPERALADLDRAVEIVDDARPQLARLHYDRARALRATAERAGPAGRADRTRQSDRLLRSALDEADRLGMARLAEQSRTLLGDSGP